MSSHEQRGKSGGRWAKRVAAAAGAFAMGTGLAACSTGNAAPQPTGNKIEIAISSPTPAGESYNPETKLQQQGLNIARTIIGILDRKDNGTEYYKNDDSPYVVGYSNKGYTIGSDGARPSADDGRVTAETGIGYRCIDNALTFVSTDMTGEETKTTKDDRFDTLETTISLRTNTIEDKVKAGKKITFNDIRQALTEETDAGGAVVESIGVNDSDGRYEHIEVTRNGGDIEYKNLLSDNRSDKYSRTRAKAVDTTIRNATKVVTEFDVKS